MKDRVPAYPGRVRLTPVSGQTNVYDMERADAPTEAGTPLDKATLLKDVMAGALGLKDDPTNLFNADAVIDGEVYSGQGGAIQWADCQRMDGYIPIESGETYAWDRVVNGFMICCYDENKTFISPRLLTYTPEATAYSSITFSNNVAFVRLSMYERDFPAGFKFYRVLRDEEKATVNNALSAVWAKAAAAKTQADATAYLSGSLVCETAAYTGTGAAAGVSLEFSAPPVFVIIIDVRGSVYASAAFLTPSGGTALVDAATNGNIHIDSTVSGNVMSWPGGGSAAMNESGAAYYCVAFLSAQS